MYFLGEVMSEKNIQNLVDGLVLETVRSMHAYHVPDSSGMIKLDAMENPYQWSVELKEQWCQRMAAADINRYPDPEAKGVVSALRKVAGIKDEYDVLLGNGSDELIQLLLMAVAKPDRVVLAPEPSFVMYRVLADTVGMDYVGVPLQDDFQLDLDAMLVAINKHQPAVTFLAQPNNPTGNLFSESAVREIVQAANGVVVIDEAYTAFTDADFLSWLDTFDNVLIMRTLSKVGLAGLRLGFMIGRTEWLSELNKIRLPYNINVLTQVSAEFALENYDVLAKQAEQIKIDRSVLQVELDKLEAVQVYDSQANFLLLRVEQARSIFEEMKEKGVLIKCLDGAHPLLKDCLRVTVGTGEENQSLIAALKSVF